MVRGNDTIVAAGVNYAMVLYYGCYNMGETILWCFGERYVQHYSTAQYRSIEYSTTHMLAHHGIRSYKHCRQDEVAQVPRKNHAKV